MSAELFTPWDVEVAHANFNATCGPCALAAFLGCEVCRVMQHFRHPFPGWCSGRDMVAALRSAGRHGLNRPQRFPEHGLAWITLDGPWRAPNLPRGAQLSHSHWVAVREGQVYDVNARAWQPRASWESGIMGADGGRDRVESLWLNPAAWAACQAERHELPLEVVA